MSEFPLPPPQPTSKKTHHHLPSLLLSDFFLFCSFILSHPLYFSYFIFFSPYLLKLLSFLSPLFITTFLLLLALLTISPNLVLDKLATHELSESKASLVLGIYRAVVEKLRAKVGHGGEEFHQYVELEAYKIVFEASSPDLGENPVEVLEIEAKEQPLASSSDDDHVVEVSNFPSQENSVSDGNLAQGKETTELVAEVKKLAGFLHEKEEKEKEVKPVSVNSNKVEGERRRLAATRSGSKGIGIRKSETKESDHYHHYGASEEDYYSTPKSNASQRADDLWSSPDNGNWDYYSPKGDQYSPSLGSFGSMRRDKEWRKTLACKLFEERHNVDGDGEGNMDMLWEAYEADSVKSQGSAISSKAKKKGKSKFGSSRSEFSYGHCSEEEDEEDEEEEEGQNGKLCCLQALKFSAGKMNLGMGRPNLVKFSKAIKGFGWLHKVGNHSKRAQRF